MEEKHLMKNIYQRINAVMAEVDYIQKGDKKVNGQYRFVSHDQVSATLHGPLTKHGIVCIPNILDMKQDGNRTEVKLEISFVNIDNPTDKMIVNYFGYGIDPQDKGIGKAVSYAFKYALLKTFCLETGDDPDSDIETAHDPKAVPLMTKDQVKALQEALSENEEVAEKVLLTLKKGGYESIEKTPSEKFAGIMKWISSQKVAVKEVA